MANVYLGGLGGIALATEATYGTDPTTGYIWQHAISSTLGKRMPRIVPSRLGLSPPAAQSIGIPYVDGETVFNYSSSDAVIGVLLKALGIRTGASAPFIYTINGGSTGYPPTTNSLFALVDYGMRTGGAHYQLGFGGLKPTQVRFELGADVEPKISVGWIGRSCVVRTATAITAAADSTIAVPGDFDVITIAAAAWGFKNIAITLDLPKTDAGRNIMGATTLREPEPSGQIRVTAAIGCELTDDTGLDTVAEIADFMAGTAMGTLNISDGTNVMFTLANGRYMGDAPGLSGNGPQEFTLNVEFDGAIIRTNA
jgi:hypothetical protein